MDEATGRHHADITAVCLLHQSLVDREDHLYEGEGSHVGERESDRKALLCCCQIQGVQSNQPAGDGAEGLLPPAAQPHQRGSARPPQGKSPQNGTERVSVTSAKTFFSP